MRSAAELEAVVDRACAQLDAFKDATSSKPALQAGALIVIGDLLSVIALALLNRTGESR
jgi:hypothetical protein